MSQEFIKGYVFYIEKNEPDKGLKPMMEYLGFEVIERPLHPLVENLKRFLTTTVNNFPGVFF